MRVLVCDDDMGFGQELTQKINDYVISSDFYTDGFKLDYYNDPKQVIPHLETHDVDILFLDISMPEIDGFEIAQYVAENGLDTLLIFVSNLEDRVFSSFKYRPFRFIRKNKYEKELYSAIREAVYDLSLKHRCITISKYNETTPIRLSRIIYAEKEPRTNYVMIHCLGADHRIRASISELKDLIDDNHFIMPSSSALINMEHIVRISNHTVFLDGGYKYCIISSKYLKSFTEKFMSYMR